MSFAGHTARKRFGQHWLRDERVLDRILEAAELAEGDRVLEVGPGRGALTERLLGSPAAWVHTIELDRDLVAGLRERFSSQARFSLCEGDVLDVPLTLPDGVQASKVVANIPYNITGPLLDRLIGRLDRPVDPPYDRLVLLVQKEVAERIRARPGHSSFSGLSVRLQLLARCESVCPVPPRCFQPPPKVQSEVIRLAPCPRSSALIPISAAGWNGCSSRPSSPGARCCATPLRVSNPRISSTSWRSRRELISSNGLRRWLRRTGWLWPGVA